MSVLVRRLRPKRAPDLVVRFEGLPGEYERVHFFAARLKFSRLLHVVLTGDQKAETVVRSLIATYEVSVSAPREWVFDNLRNIRISLPCIERAVPHAFLRDLLADIGGIPMFCTSRKSNQKGSVENLVSFAGGDFFARAFCDRADVAAQLVDWLRETNHVRPCCATGEDPAVRLLRERALPRSPPEPVTTARNALREQRVVSGSTLVHREGTAYAVDPAAVGHTVDLRVGVDFIEVVDEGRVVARHPRRAKHGVVRSREDRQATLGALVGRQPGFFKRECLRELGEAAEAFLTRLVHAGPPEDWHAPVAALFDLLQEHGGDRVLDAITMSLGRGDVSVSGVLRALDVEAA